MYLQKTYVTLRETDDPSLKDYLKRQVEVHRPMPDDNTYYFIDERVCLYHLSCIDLYHDFFDSSEEDVIFRDVHGHRHVFAKTGAMIDNSLFGFYKALNI